MIIERGIVRRGAAGLEFDASAVAGALPESVQLLLASRVDRLTPADRSLLQTASVIGRSFDPDLVAAVAGMGETSRKSFEAMEALDLIARPDQSIDYVFKHALVRDALYHGLLSGPRSTLHLKVAEELERRGGNRLTEIAEILAYHYAETPCVDKAFRYLVLAGEKSLDVYSLPEAEQYFRKALQIFEAHDAPADRWSAVIVMQRLLETLTNKGGWREAGAVASKFMPLVREFGETPELVNVLYYQAMALWAQLDIRSARVVALAELSIAERLGDRKATLWAQGNLLFVTSFLGLNSAEAASKVKEELLNYGPKLGDRYVINWCYYAIAWDYVYRGLMKEAREVAMELIATGEARNDPRAIGQANMLLGYAEMFADNFIEASSHADECIRLAVTPNERRQGALIKAACRVLLGHPQEELAKIRTINSELHMSGMDIATQRAPIGVALAMLGRVADGIRVIEDEIEKSDAVGDQIRAAWHRIILAELLIQILSGKEKPKARVLIENLRTILSVIIFGADRARRLLEQAAAVQQLNERGLFFARINLDLGTLAMMKKKREEARRYFAKARVGAENQGANKLLQKIDAALAELQQER